MILVVRLVMAKRKRKRMDGREMERDGRAGKDGVLSVSLWFGFFLFTFSSLWVGVGGLWIV
jgi:hypothetical protein